MPLRLSTGLLNHMATTGSFLAGINNCYMFIYTGGQPATADAAATGTLVATISGGGVVNTPLTFEDGAGVGDIQKTAAQDWEGLGIADGTAGWYRLHIETTDQATTQANAAAASTSFARVDGTIAASGAQLNMSNTTVVTGAPQRVADYSMAIPPGA